MNFTIVQVLTAAIVLLSNKCDASKTAFGWSAPSMYMRHARLFQSHNIPQFD